MHYLPDGRRGRVFGEAVYDLSETTFSDWRVTGPRTTRWLLQAVGMQGFSPVQRHYWWRSTQQLSSSDIFVDEHLFLSELLENMVCVDQLNAPELHIGEILARRFQLYEEYYGSTLQQSEGGAAAEIWMDERQLFLGQERGRGRALVAPSLEAWVATKLSAESQLLKERRKGREERALASGAAAAEEEHVAPGGAAAGGGAGRGGGRGNRRGRGK